VANVLFSRDTYNTLTSCRLRYKLPDGRLTFDKVKTWRITLK